MKSGLIALLLSGICVSAAVADDRDVAAALGVAADTTAYACCLGDSCLVLPEEPCTTAGGMWLEGVESCDPWPCWGVCCFGLDYVIVMPEDCEAMGGRWLGNVPWEPNPCPNACCLVGDNCEMVAMHECELLGGYSFPDYTTCEPNPCGSPANDVRWGNMKGMFRQP